MSLTAIEGRGRKESTLSLRVLLMILICGGAVATCKGFLLSRVFLICISYSMNPIDSLTPRSSENDSGCLRELMGVFCNNDRVPGRFELGQLHSFEPIYVVMLPSFEGIEISFLLNMIFYIMCIWLRFKINSFIACL